MNDALFQIMSALDFGYSITEINYHLFEGGKYPQKVGLKKPLKKKDHTFMNLK
ncbi:MAG: hypothetical protein CM15mV101_340 [uncultured marine virus]|nr:MAG: hypothetical protein CM15mV101_340 [uncultured marine virus]